MGIGATGNRRGMVASIGSAYRSVSPRGMPVSGGMYYNPVDLGALLSAATLLNDVASPTFSRASTAYDPYNLNTALSGARRRRPFTIGGTTYSNGYDFIEGSRQNLCIQSSTFNSWGTKTDVTVTDSALTPADGTGSASRILEGSAGTAKALSAAMTITAGRIVTSCVRFKFKATNSWVMVTVASDTLANGWRAWANISTGVVGSQALIGTGTALGVALTALGGGEYMLVSSGTVAAAATACQVQVNSASADASTTRVNAADYYAWGSQVEMMPASATAGFPSSLITTTTVAVTRAADSLSVPYVLGQTGTVLALCIPYTWTGDQDGVTSYQVWASDDTSNSKFQRATATTMNLRRMDAAGAEGPSNTPGFVQGALSSPAMTWDSTAISGFIAGAPKGTPDTTLTPPYNVNVGLWIGSSITATAAFHGWVALLAWSRALTADEIYTLYKNYPVAA